MVNARRFFALVALLVFSAAVSPVAADTFYVSDPNQHAILKIDEAGTVTTFASNVVGALGLAFDGQGNLLVATGPPSASILRFDSAGNSSVVVNSGLLFPCGLTIDPAGNIYVADFSANAVVRFSSGGTRSIFASGLHGPIGMTFDRNGNLFVANRLNDTVVKILPDGSSSVFAATNLDHPYGLAFDRNGSLYVSNGNDSDENVNDQIVRFDPAGNASVFATGVRSGRGLAFDSRSKLYALNLSTNGLLRFEADGSRIAFVSYPLIQVPTFIVAKPDLDPPQIADFQVHDGSANVTFTSSMTQRYTIESCDDLQAPAWQPLEGGSDLSGTGGPLLIVDPTAGDARGRRFYRVTRVTVEDRGQTSARPQTGTTR
ncbi:MAG: NHL repeat-containing protein [Verrucomicrobiota bacterium]|nr:NHL repeat-containing protein [Verrucomicrobiota bacterium]